MAVRELDVPGLTPLIGAGVYYGAALSEAAMYRGQHVFVLGGANSAGQGALFFARYAVAGHDHRAQAVALAGDVAVPRRPDQEHREHHGRAPTRKSPRVHGNGASRAPRRSQRHDRRDEQPRQGNALFIFIGVAPHTDAFTPLVATDEKGFILTGADVRAAGQTGSSIAIR